MKTGGHIKPCKVGSVEEHNERDKEYVERMEQSKHPLHFYPTLALRPNHNSYNQEREQYRDKATGKPLKVAQIFNQMIEVYTEHDKRHRRPPLKERERFDPKSGKMKTIAGWSPIREMVVVIKPDTKSEDFDKVNAWFRKQRVEPMFLSLHFDEGHLDDAGNLKANNHAHMGLDFFDWETGKTIKLGPAKMKELQTVLADALGMERGEIKEVTGKEHMDVPEYRETMEAIKEKKQQEAEIDARLDEKRQEHKQLSGDNARLKQENTQLQVVNTAKTAAVAIGQGIAGVFGQSKKDKTIEQLQDTIAHEPERTAAAVADARADERQKVITEIKKAADLRIRKDGKETAQDIGNAWRRNFDAKKNLTGTIEDMKEQHQEELDAKDKVITQKENTIRSLQGKFDSLMGWVNSIWETLKGSLDAIVQRVSADRDYFTHDEVEAVEKGMVNAKDDKEREDYAKDICTVAATVTDVDEDIRADVMSIARRDYDPSEKIEEAEKQQRSWHWHP